MKVEGVHPFAKNVFLIEVVFDKDQIDWFSVTQSVPGVSRENWQVAYDERSLEQLGHWAFFFHYLDLARPLESQFGTLELPAPTPIPSHLADIVYEPPC